MEEDDITRILDYEDYQAYKKALVEDSRKKALATLLDFRDDEVSELKDKCKQLEQEIGELQDRNDELVREVEDAYQRGYYVGTNYKGW